jgi:hypothetical protein
MGEPRLLPFRRRQGEKMAAHGIDRPLQIDGGRPGSRENGARRIEVRIRSVGAHGERQSIGRRHADERRATHLHRFDGVRRLKNSIDGENYEFVRQPRLIDHFDGLGAAVQPNGSKRLAFDPHSCLPFHAASVARMRKGCHAKERLPAPLALLQSGHSFACPVSIAIAANTLVEKVVFMLDSAIEVRCCGTLRRTRVRNGLTCRCQIIFVQ